MIFSRGWPCFSYIASMKKGSMTSIMHMAATLLPAGPRSKKKSGTPMSAPQPKQTSCLCEMQTRNKSFLLRLTEQEYATLKRKSELAGLKMNPFLVSLINGCEIHPRTPDSCKALARQVAAVGNNLNQLARIANFNGKAEDAYLQEAQQIMTRIWLLMKEQL